MSDSINQTATQVCEAIHPAWICLNDLDILIRNVMAVRPMTDEFLAERYAESAMSEFTPGYMHYFDFFNIHVTTRLYLALKRDGIEPRALHGNYIGLGIELNHTFNRALRIILDELMRIRKEIEP